MALSLQACNQRGSGKGGRRSAGGMQAAVTKRRAAAIGLCGNNIAVYLERAYRRSNQP